MQAVDVVAQRERVRAAGTIEKIERVRRREEPLRLVLRNQVDLCSGEIAQLARARGDAVDAALRTPRREHLALDDQIVVVREREARIREPRAQRRIRRNLERRPRAFRAAAHGVAVCAPAERELQSAQQHGLSGPGLARDDGEPRGEVELGARDEPDVLDRQTEQTHRDAPPIFIS